MSDMELAGEIARLWVDNKGDVIGFVYCQEAIKQAIQYQIQRREELNREQTQ